MMYTSVANLLFSRSTKQLSPLVGSMSLGGARLGLLVLDLKFRLQLAVPVNMVDHFDYALRGSHPGRCGQVDTVDRHLI